MGYLILIGAVATMALASHRWSTRLDEADSGRMQALAQRRAAGWLSKELDQPFADVQKALNEQLRGTPSPILERLMRIECQLSVLNARECRLLVVVMLADGAQARVGEISGDLSREELPSSMRSEFIRNGNKPQTFVLYDINAN